jgi:hypothetical protein
MPGDLGGCGGQGVGLVAELRLPGGVPEQQPEPVGVGRGGADQGGDGILAVVAGADRLGQPGAGAVDYPGSAVGWEDATIGPTAFVVELPAGPLSPAGVRRHVSALDALLH